jgi:hypothetical protein
LAINETRKEKKEKKKKYQSKNAKHQVQFPSASVVVFHTPFQEVQNIYLHQYQEIHFHLLFLFHTGQLI